MLVAMSFLSFNLFEFHIVGDQIIKSQYVNEISLIILLVKKEKEKNVYTKILISIKQSSLILAW